VNDSAKHTNTHTQNKIENRKKKTGDSYLKLSIFIFNQRIYDFPEDRDCSTLLRDITFDIKFDTRHIRLKC
jgi:hypothetical protein